MNPFVIDKWGRKPFLSTERSFPVDFGAPLDLMLVVNLSYPPAYQIEETPSNVAITLPGGGGKYLFSVTALQNKISMMSQLVINKSVYSAGEYRALRDLFSRVVELEESTIVFTKKK